MKKLIFCFLIVLMGSCKDDDKKMEPEINYAPEFIGNYWTKTADAIIGTDHIWEVTELTKNQLGILYTRNTTVTAGGQELKGWQKYALANVAATGKDTFTINEEVNVEQSSGAALKQRVEGIGTKVLNAAGVPQINITLKFTNTATGVAAEEYLEFKKQ